MSFDKLFGGSGAELLPKSAAECADILRKHNEWRRGGDGEQSCPKDIGLAIDMAISVLDQQPDIDTLEQESRQMRARMLRLESESGERSEAVECLEIQLDFLNGVRDKNIRLSAKLREAEKQRDELMASIDRCYKMLLSEPDTNGALFKAENILRDAIASAKGGAA